MRGRRAFSFFLVVLLVMGIFFFNPLTFNFIHDAHCSTTTTFQVATNETDQTNKPSDSTWTDSSAYDAMVAGGTPIDGGFGFTTVTIPQGAIINSAIISWYVASTAYDDPRMHIHAEDVDNGNTFGSGTTNLRSRSLTTSYVDWDTTAVGTGWKNQTISDVVEEITNRTGWASGNRLNIIAEMKSGSGKSFYTRCHNFDITLAAKLYLTYTVPPQASNKACSTNIIGRKPIFRTYWTGTSLSGYIFSWNKTGSWQNGTWTDPWSGTPNTGWSNVSKWKDSDYLELPLTTGTKLGWRIYCNDTVGWGDTGIQTVTTQTLDLSNSKTLTIDGSNITDANANTWIVVGSSLSFKSLTTAEWVEYDSADEYAEWIYLKDIENVQSGTSIHLREFQYYDGSTWKNPSSVNSSKPTTGTPSNSIDGNTATYWTVGWVDQPAWIKYNTAYDDVQKIRFWCDKADVGTNITVSSVQVGKVAPWDHTGSSPWISNTDSNRVWTYKANRAITCFTVSNSTYTSNVVGNLTAYVNCSGNGATTSFNIGYYAEYINYSSSPTYPSPKYWFNSTAQSTSTGWAVKTFTLTRMWWSAIYLDSLKIRLLSGSTVTAKLEIDKVWITYSAMTQENMTRWLFDNMVETCLINETVPMIRRVNENTHTYYRQAYAGLLVGTSLYAYTGNTTYLSYTKQYVDWLNATTIDYLWRTYNVTADNWHDGNWGADAYPHAYQVGVAATNLLHLAMFVGRNTTYLPLLNKAIENFTSMWFPDDGYPIPYTNVYLNGTPYDADIMHNVWTHDNPQPGKVIDAMIYAASVANNATLKQMAMDFAFAIPLSAYYLPYHGFFRNGSKDPSYAFCKQYTAGYYLLGLNSLYFWTGNTTVKNLIKNVAEYVSVAFWNATRNRFFYRVDSADNPPPPLGTGPSWQLAEKTMPVLHDSLLVSYLIWANETWATKLRNSWRTYMDDGQSDCGLTNDLLTHQGYGSAESDPFNYGSMMRVGTIYYNLNRTGFYHNQSVLTDLLRLYGAVASAHSKTLGLICYSNASTYSWYVGDELYYVHRDVYSIITFLQNKTSTINNFNDYWTYFGDPFTGEVPPSILTWSDIGTNTTKAGQPCQFYVQWLVTQTPYLDHWRFCSNNTGTWANSSWYEFPSSVKVEYARYNATLNATAKSVIYKFYANDTAGKQAATDNATVLIGGMEEFWGSIALTITIGIGRAVALGVGGILQLIFSIDKLKDIAVNIAKTINLLITIASTAKTQQTTFTIYGNILITLTDAAQKLMGFNALGNINLLFNIASKTASSWNVQGSLNLLWNIQSVVSATAPGLLKFTGSIALTLSATALKLISFNAEGTIPLTFTVTSITNYFKGLNLLGNIALSLSDAASRSVAMYPQGNIALTFEVHTAVSMITMALNFFGEVALWISSVGLSSLPIPITPVLYATPEFVMACGFFFGGIGIIALCFAMISMNRNQREKDEEGESVD